MKKLKMGMVGGGGDAFIGGVHRRAALMDGEIEIVAGALSSSREKALASGRAWGLPKDRNYGSWEEMLDREELNALWVCTPPLHHRGPTVSALEREIHVYLEKPIARTLEDAAAIVAAAESAAGVCAVGYQWHATELLEEAREALAGQEVALLVGRNFGPVAGRAWFIDPVQGGGQILERGSHHIDFQRALAGEIRSVQAMAAGQFCSLDR